MFLSCSVGILPVQIAKLTIKTITNIKEQETTNMKKMKSIVALVLALVIAFSAFTCAYAAPADDSAVAKAVDVLAESAESGGTHADCHDGDCGHDPVVIVPGINHSPTYLYDENDEPVLNKDGKKIGGTLLIIDEDNILEVVLKKLALPLIKMLVTQTDSGFTKGVYETICAMFNIQQCDDEGVPVNNLKTEKYGSLADMDESTRSWAYRMIPMQKLTDVIGEDHVYFFTFNLVGSPMDSAAALDEYIQQVKKATGHDKVNLLNVSLGGTIFTAYIDEYGLGDVNQVVNAVAATDGSDIIADFLTRGEAGFRIDDEFLYHEFIPAIMDELSDSATLGYLLNFVIRIIPQQVFKDTLTAAMDGLADTLLINCPQFWALVPSDRYDALAQKYLTDKDHAVLKAKTDRYHQAQLNLKKNVLAAHEAGVRIDSIAGAGLSFGDIEYTYFSAIKSALTVNSDGIIQLSSTTMGATGATPGEKLPDDYKPAKVGYMSVDGSIDASTAVLPDNTWIFIGQHHEAGNNDVVLTLACAIMTDPELKDVHSKPDVWPQYNGTCRTKEIRRWLLPDAKKLRAEINEMSPEERPDAALVAELDAAIADGEAALNMTIANAEQADAATERLTNALVALGAREPAEEESEVSAVLEQVCAFLSLIAVKVIGSKGYSDIARVVMKVIIQIIEIIVANVA